jgi:hypothetical protein
VSDRLPIVDNLCKNPENHKTHLCELKSAKKMDQVEKLTADPKFICGNCGNTANKEGALCAPGPLQD